MVSTFLSVLYSGTVNPKVLLRFVILSFQEVDEGITCLSKRVKNNKNMGLD